MFTKLLHKAMHQPHLPSQKNGGLTSGDLDIRMVLHYGVPQTSSILAFDPVQRLLAIGTLDGRIKIIGGENIEVFLLAPKKAPYKFLEFLCNQGFLIAVSSENEIQVWDLKKQHLACALQWESNTTALSVINGTCFIYVGDDEGSISVLKYDEMENKIFKLPYHISADALTEAACISFPSHQSVVGILPQPSTYGSRVVIAYESGVIILWDIADDQIIMVKGHYRGEESVDSPTKFQCEDQQSLSDINGGKEICSLCWVCKAGNILAVGYIDGDILLWNLSTKSHKDRISSSDVIRLQLSSGARRLPVIVLHWSADAKSDNDCSGFLFMYGGDERGSEDVLTVLHLDWPLGGHLNCVARVDLTLSGSFADMVLIPENGITQDSGSIAAFVLTNPGQLHFFDASRLLTSEARGERYIVKPDNFPVAIPTIDPCMTISNIFLIEPKRNDLKVLLEKDNKQGTILPVLSSGIKWPLTGGITGTSAKGSGMDKMFVAGYQDGSIRLWDATYPILQFLSVIEGNAYHLKDFQPGGESSPISALEFCSSSLAIAAGTESGLVRIYTIKESADELQFRHLTNDKLEVHTVPCKGTIHCTAILSVVNSPVQALSFVHVGARLAVGFKCGRVLLLEIESLAILFNLDTLFGLNMEIIYLSSKAIPFSCLTPKCTAKESGRCEKELLFILTKDARIVVADGKNGGIINTRPVCPKTESTAISLHIVGVPISPPKRNAVLDGIPKNASDDACQVHVDDLEAESQTLNINDMVADLFILLCCEDALRLYSLQSVLEGEKKCLQKVNLDKICCWSTTFKGQTDNAYGVMLLYQTGDLEIRSFPSLEVLTRSSLMSILRWGYKRNFNRNVSSCGDGQVSMVNGSELSFISILSCENGFRMAETLPSLHDEVLAAASHAAIGISYFHKKKQDVSTSVFFGGIFKGAREEVDVISLSPKAAFVKELERHFSRVPFSSPSTFIPREEKELSIDDIEIDDPQPILASSSYTKHGGKGLKKEREKLFDGATTISKPRIRTHEEIITKYKFGGDAKLGADYAREKLVQRQEKLQRAQERAEELRNNAQDFESLAKELAKTMEKKKFWNF